ncbi:hypothetical protein LSAT2_026488 [Lamellibrachia satsuma]|nr:hypothetical protein LSAT2_026488 [Lamellibrachia satsuma]
MKNFTAVLAIATVTLALGSVEVEGTSWYAMANCVRSKLGWGIVTKYSVRCAIWQMYSQYRKMNSIGCLNCDKYFHCQANYNVVRYCPGSFAKRAAIAISECREISQQGTDSPDGREDMKANAYGRRRGNCYRKYGCASRCAYNPRNGSCRRSNC